MSKSKSKSRTRILNNIKNIKRNQNTLHLYNHRVPSVLVHSNMTNHFLAIPKTCGAHWFQPMNRFWYHIIVIIIVMVVA